VAGDLNEAAEVNSIANVLAAYGVSPIEERLQAIGPALVEPLQDLVVGKFAHSVLTFAALKVTSMFVVACDV
jgi:hypothetical protein